MKPRFTTRSERFILAGVALTLVALKFRAAAAAGNTVPAALSYALLESAVVAVALAAIAVSCRGSGFSRWAMLAGGGIQIVIASLSPPALVESWTQPWVVGLACTAVLALTRFRSYRFFAVLVFIVVTGAAWNAGLFQPHLALPLSSPAGSHLAGTVLRAWPLPALLAVIAFLGGAMTLIAIPIERNVWRPHWSVREVRGLPWLALLAYAAVLLPFLDVTASGPDSAGYLGSARLLQHFQIAVPLPQPADLAHSGLNPIGFLPVGFAPAAQPGVMVPTSPLGLPLLFCFALWGMPAPLAIPAVILFHLLAGLVLTYLLGRLSNLNKRWSFAAAAVVGLCPLYQFVGLQPMSDLPSLVWVTAAIVLGIAIRKSPERLTAALFCGVVTAVAVLIRPANAIALPAILIALPWRGRVLLRWVIGGLPFAVALAIYHRHLYGSSFATGYGEVGGRFGVEWVVPTLGHYALWLPILLTPAVGAILVLPFLGSVPVPRRWLFAIWIGTFGAFYATYGRTHETWWYLRFLLPIVPALAIGAAIVLQRRAELFPRGWGRSVFATALGIVVAGWLLVADQRLSVWGSFRDHQVYRDSSLWLEQHAPTNAIVVCSSTSGALNYYSHLAFFQPSSAADAAQITAAATAARRPLFAEFFSSDQQPLPWFTGGHWSQVNRFGDLLIWRWDPA